MNIRWVGEMVDQECQWQSYVHWILRVASGDTLK